MGGGLPHPEYSLGLDIRSVFNMRALKLICAFFFAVSVLSIFQGIGRINSASSSIATRHSVFITILSFVQAIFWIGAFYGIQKKSLIAWKLGWVVIAFGFLEFLILGLSVTNKLSQTDSPRIASISIVVGAGIVVVYWALWWKKQKSYFSGRSHPTR